MCWLSALSALAEKIVNISMAGEIVLGSRFQPMGYHLETPVVKDGFYTWMMFRYFYSFSTTLGPMHSAFDAFIAATV